MIFFRVDANEYIAAGHVMRCLTIAEDLKKREMDCCFLVSDMSSVPLIEQKGFAYQCLCTDWRNFNTDKEYEKIKKLVKAGDWIVVDSYSANNAYVMSIREYARVLFFDDLCEEKIDADIVLNYNLYFSRFNYKEIYKDSETKLLLGGQFVPLREQFCKVVNRTIEKSENLLFMCGGGDPLNVLAGYLMWLEKKEPQLLMYFQWDVIVGAYNSHKTELEQLAYRYPNIRLLCNVEDMAHVMLKNDLCICAASTVLYECAVTQLPTMFFTVADNQQYDREAFSQDNMMLYVGDYESERVTVMENLTENLRVLRDYGFDGLNMNYQTLRDKISIYGAHNIIDALLST